MTLKSFNQYHFSVNTRVRVEDNWGSVADVDFDVKEIGVRFANGAWTQVSYKDIQDIKEATASEGEKTV